MEDTPEKFDSADDRRTENNTMRQQYRVLTDLEKQKMAHIKGHAQAFHDYLVDIGGKAGSRELSLAKTKIEEAAMWAVKHITR